MGYISDYYAGKDAEFEAQTGDWSYMAEKIKQQDAEVDDE